MVLRNAKFDFQHLILKYFIKKPVLTQHSMYSQVPIKRVGPNKRVSRVGILSKFHKRLGPNKQVG